MAVYYSACSWLMSSGDVPLFQRQVACQPKLSFSTRGLKWVHHFGVAGWLLHYCICMMGTKAWMRTKFKSYVLLQNTEYELNVEGDFIFTS